jgi:translation initiation factor 5B
LLRQANIPVREIGIGPVLKKDVISAYTTSMQNKYVGAVLSFNVATFDDAIEEAKNCGIPIFNSKIIYNLLDKYIEWAQEQKKKDTEKIMCASTYPAQIIVLPNCFFRLCKPAIFGVEIKVGKLKAKAPIMNEQGEMIGQVKAIQHNGKSVEEAKAGDQVAVSIDGPYCGKTFKTGESLVTYIGREQEKLLAEKCSGEFSEAEKQLLGKIMQIEASRLIK